MQKLEERETVTLVNQGEKIFGVLHRPIQTDTKTPAVLICSGFAGNKAGKFRLFVRLAQELAKMGIATLRFDYRGAGDSEGDYKDLTLEGNVSDALTCLKFLADDVQIDHSRIGILGRSLGGVVSILTAKRYQNIKSLVLWAPVFNSNHWKALWDSFQSNRLDTSQKQEVQSLPAGIPNACFLKEFFQLKLQEELSYLKEVPLLHIHAEQDVVVSGEHEQAYRQERHLLENSRFIKLANSDHDFSHFPDQDLAIKETCEWFQQTL